MKKEKTLASKIGIGLLIVLVLGSCGLLTLLFGLLMMSATPSMMPTRWTLMALSPIAVIGSLTVGTIAYFKQKQVLIYVASAVLIGSVGTIVYFFLTLGPTQ